MLMFIPLIFYAIFSTFLQSNNSSSVYNMTSESIDTIFAILPIVMIMGMVMLIISFVMKMFDSEPREKKPKKVEPKKTEFVEKEPKTKRKKDEWDI